MASPLRKFFESIAYAGLKPTTPGKPPERGKLRKFWDRLVLGNAPADPLYLSNRTWKQKLRFGLILGAPLAIVLGSVLYALMAPAPVVEKTISDLPPEEIAARTRIIPKDFSVPQNNDLQILEVTVDKSSNPNAVTGKLKNNTGRFYTAAELSFDLTDEDGSAIGGVSTRLPNVEPHSTTPFRFQIPQANAVFVLVREARAIF